MKWHFENLKSSSQDLSKNANFRVGGGGGGTEGKVALWEI